MDSDRLVRENAELRFELKRNYCTYILQRLAVGGRGSTVVLDYRLFEWTTDVDGVFAPITAESSAAAALAAAEVGADGYSFEHVEFAPEFRIFPDMCVAGTVHSAVAAAVAALERGRRGHRLRGQTVSHQRRRRASNRFHFAIAQLHH